MSSAKSVSRWAASFLCRTRVLPLPRARRSLWATPSVVARQLHRLSCLRRALVRAIILIPLLMAILLLVVL